MNPVPPYPFPSIPSPSTPKKQKRGATAEEKAAERRRRRRVDPAKRKRVAIACESCKKRKQKCDGQHPCNICRRRGFTCVFLPHQDNRISTANLTPGTYPSTSTRSPTTNHKHSIEEGTADSRIGITPPSSPVTDEEVTAVGDGNPRILRDPRGHFRFVGESGAHSFLEQIRQLFRQVSGESLFTEDPERFNMVDGPTHNILPNAAVQLPSRALANELVYLFEIRIQPFSYVFDMDEFKRVLDTTYENPIACPRDWLCRIHLTFALAGVYLPETVDSGKFFESGMGLCVGDLIENGDFWIVQAYLLVGLYYQITCKRNAFWIAIGMAIRFAEALGMHRACVNRALPARERLLRQRVWRTLYIHDRFASSALGRPCAIRDLDWDDRETAEEFETDRLSVEMIRISYILGDILRQVYRARTISSEAASTLARRLQEWSDNLPNEMTVHSLLRNKSVPSYDRHSLQRLHLAHLNAVILLTRPFLFHFVSTAVKNPTADSVAGTHTEGTVARLARACVLSATRSIEIVQTLFVENSRPSRPPFLIYFMFLAGLILLLDAYRDKSLLLNPAIASVKIIMSSYSPIDPSARRYHRILEEMEAAIGYNRTHRPTGQLDALADLLYGNGNGKAAAPNTADELLNPIVKEKSPGEVSLSEFLNDGSMTLPDGLEGEAFSFDFDNSAAWDTWMLGEGDFRGLLLNPEF